MSLTLKISTKTLSKQACRGCFGILFMSRIQNCNWESHLTKFSWRKHLVANFKKSPELVHPVDVDTATQKWQCTTFITTFIIGWTLVIVESLSRLKVGYNLSIYILYISIYLNDSSFINCYKYSHNLIYIVFSTCESPQIGQLNVYIFKI